MVMTYDSLVADLEDYLDRDDARLQAQIPNFISLGEIRCAREVKNLRLKTSVFSTMVPGTYVYEKPTGWLDTISINYGNTTVYSSYQTQSTSGTKKVWFTEPHDLAVDDIITAVNFGSGGFNGSPYTITAVGQEWIEYVNGSSTQALTADTSGRVFGAMENRKYLKPRSYEYCCDYWPDRTQLDEPLFYADYDFDHFFIVPTPAYAHPFELVFFQKPTPLSSSNQENWFTKFSPDLLLYACLLEAVPYLKNDERIPTWKDYYLQASNSIKTENAERKNDATIVRDEK